ncbi:PREDICTED: uncharacterized protein LOC109331497 isoform X2 [Lupinus angustifolius]|uniref:uncharacterized protein LOC109331497 isoform X2 n=1 Tax=Lupinus angustifolius TaxID=3871 RepID=UPI00092EA16C|nr:PREDICTED: uncharacterized protein LOC109331497 isoform X2 [Lupinus angustifolius]
MALNNNTCFNLSLSMCSSIVTTQTDYSSSSSLNNNNVCVHLSMGVCPCSHASLSHCESCTSCSSSTKKRKQGQKDDTNGARKRARNDVERIRWGSSKSYVFIDKWVQDFVKRRHLKEGDEVAFHWDPYNHHFAFTVLQVF